MSSLSGAEKLKFESLFSMSGGYVIDFSNSSFQRFVMDCVRLDIYDSRYERHGTSKANRLRALWDIEPDSVVGRLLEEMLQYYEVKETLTESGVRSFNRKLFEECMNIASRLQGKTPRRTETAGTTEDFLKKEVDEVSAGSLGIDGAVTAVLEQRIIEVKQCLNSGVSLSVIFLCGSILEGILLGIATKYPREFNQAGSCPKNKDTGKPKPFPEWSLANFIDAAHELGFLGLDVKKYSHSLRDFRNYIHPYEQMMQKFTPDAHTAKISWQVLKAAMNDIQGKSKT